MHTPHHTESGTLLSSLDLINIMNIRHDLPEGTWTDVVPAHIPECKVEHSPSALFAIFHNFIWCFYRCVIWWQFWQIMSSLVTISRLRNMKWSWITFCWLACVGNELSSVLAIWACRKITDVMVWMIWHFILLTRYSKGVQNKKLKQKIFKKNTNSLIQVHYN